MMYLLYGFGKTNQSALNYIRNKTCFEWMIAIEKGKDYFDEETTHLLLNKVDVVVKSPGIKFNTPLIKMANKLNIDVISDFELFGLLFKEVHPIVVTGSLGKTTTVSMIANIFSCALNKKIEPYGNIGKPIFDVVKNEEDCDLLIVEASSFILHNTYSLKPHVLVITNVFPHHLEYHETFANYLYDKTKLINNMGGFDLLVCDKKDDLIYRNHTNNMKILTFSLNDKTANAYIEDGFMVINKKRFISVEELYKNEDHNLLNMLASALVAKYYHIDDDIIKKALIDFQGVKYRFEKLYENDKLVIFNDSKSTTPMATVASIKYINQNYDGYSLILIMGGILKDDSIEEVNKNLDNKTLVYCYGKSKYQLSVKINSNYIKVFSTVEEIVDDIFSINLFNKKNVILFSPCCVSYDQFHSFEERGKLFEEIVLKHIKQ